MLREATVEPEARRALLARLLEQEAARPVEVLASTGQKRLWFAMRAAGPSAIYNCPLAIEVEGPVDAEALSAALQVLVDRHESLRTRFREEDGELYQVIAPHGTLRLQCSSEIDAARFAEAPFDLERGPLYRAALVSKSDREHVILLNAHHIVSDGWSQGVLLRELMAAYTGATLPPPAVRYGDFAAWQRTQETPSASVAFWRDALAAVEPLRLPTDFERPAVVTTKGARIPVSLPIAPVHAVAERENASLFQVVLAAFQMVLSRWCPQERFVVGTPAHNRGRPELEDVIGFFVSTVPVPVALSGDETLVDAFARLRRSAVDALAHSDVSFDELVALAPSSRAPGMPPLVQTLFVWQQALVPDTGISDVPIRARELDTRTSKFDLTLSLRPQGDRLVGHAEFRADLFAPATIEMLVGAVEPTIAQLDEAPTTRLRSAFAASAPASTSPALGTPSPTAVTYARTFARSVDQPAVWTSERTLTYRQLDAAASALACEARLDGAPLALVMPTSVEAIVGILAAWKSGSPYVPIDPDWPRVRIDRILEETGARQVAIDVDALLVPSRARTPAGVLAATPDDLAYIIYTSGSTGEPKGVMVPHRALAHLESALGSTIYEGGLRPPRRVGIFGALSFDTTVKQIVRLLRGDCLCPIPPSLKASPGELAAYLQTAKLDVVDMTPSWLRVLLDAGLMFSGQLVLLGGEPIDRALWRELADRQSRGEASFVNVYGPTEATVDATWAPVNGSEEPSLGRPLPGTTIWLLGDGAAPVPPGFAGEIAIAGGGVANGYLDREQQTAAVFQMLELGGEMVRVYRTGDFARVRGDGALVFLGRRDRQVKRHGQRIELDEIEATLRSHDAISDAAVVARDGTIEAWCASALTSDEIAAHLAARLPKGFLPDVYRARRELPRNGSGKIDYAALVDAAPVKRPAVPLSGPEEEAIAEIWTELLGAPPAGADADFFASGGDSLTGLRLIARLEKKLGVPLDAAWLASTPTPRTLAAALRSELPEDGIVWLTPRGRRRLALVHATGGDVQCYRALASLLESSASVAGLPVPQALPASLTELASSHASRLAAETDGDGEIILGGWSLGGLVALETARQLRACGARVPFVALFDARLPGADARARCDAAPAGLSKRTAARADRLLELWQRHELQPYDGDVVLIAGSYANRVEVSRWLELVPKMVVVETGAPHQKMLEPPFVENVAHIVKCAM